MTNRKKAIIRRNIFLAVCIAALIAAIAVLVFVVSLIKTALNNNGNGNISSDSSITSSQDSSSKNESTPTNTEPTTQYVQMGDYTLDANFSLLALINADNPLPEDYDSRIREHLVEIDPQYRNNNYVTQIHEDVYPYITAMVANAQKDGVDLRVWSPFRSYAIQKDLFQKQVTKWGGDEAKAASIVARPGTSEHNTGFCADFNTSNDWFENTKMFSWMKENAEDYGFILRYPKDKINETGVIYESWHWRFVGINAAKEINKMGVTLEKYVELKGLEPQGDLENTLK